LREGLEHPRLEIGGDADAVIAHRDGNARTAGIPVVFMTARVQRSEVAHLLSLGAAGVVAKPFDPLTLAKSVRACVACEAIPAARA
jgi:DNA-binding response OmpR family regulator